MNEIIKENKNIEDMIYEVRGVQVHQTLKYQ